MGVVANAVGPRAGVVFEADADVDFLVVVLAGLNHFGAVLFECAGGFFAGADDSDVPGLVPVGVGEEDEDERSEIGLVLGEVHVADGAPSGFATVGAGDPIGLSVGEELLAVIGWAEKIDAETFCGGGGEGAAVGVVSGPLVVSAAIGLAGLPVDVFIGEPEALDMHAVEGGGEARSGGSDGAATGEVFGEESRCEGGGGQGNQECAAGAEGLHGGTSWVLRAIDLVCFQSHGERRWGSVSWKIGLLAEAVEDGLRGYRSAEDEAGGHAEDQGEVVLVDAVEDADGLEDVESAEGEEGDAFGGFLAPEGDGLREEEEAVDYEAQAEEDGDELLHGEMVQAGVGIRD